MTGINGGRRAPFLVPARAEVRACTRLLRPPAVPECVLDHSGDTGAKNDGKGSRKMRFIHMADVHLGARPDAGPLYTGVRPRELWETFEHVIRVCEEEKTDLLLIAGDLFHRQPLVRELKEADYLFSELTHTKVVLIAGNHDHIGKNSNYRTFRWNDNVYPLFGEKIQYADFPELDTAVYGLSYHSREIGSPLYDGIRAAGVRRREILLAHGGDDRHIPFDCQKLERAGFDYIALGHIHKPQVLRKNRILYAGALEPTDRNDTGAHGFVKGEITDRGVRTQWIPCAVRSYIHFSVDIEKTDTNGSVAKKIKKFIDENGNENIYKLILKGERDPEVQFDTERITKGLNILDIADATRPAYDFDRLYAEYEDTVLGRFIESFRGCQEGGAEYEALCEGVEALLASRRQERSVGKW